MIKVPFSQDKAAFAEELKPCISGVNVTLDYENIASSLSKVSATMPGVISKALYDRLLTLYEGNAGDEPERMAINYLQRAMIHFAFFEHTIYIQLRVSNDGITTKKNDDETTAYKYQIDELKDNLLSTGWFWVNSLIQFLNENLSNFPEWENSEQKQDSDKLPVGLSDFNKWVGVDQTGGEYFMISAGWLIREVWMDCVLSRMESAAKTDKVARALCYEVMGRACERLAYSCLPSPIRRDIDNEMGKNHRAQADKDIRERIAGKFLQKAATYWGDLDLELKRQAIAEQKKTQSNEPVFGSRRITEDDKFFVS